MSTTHDYKTKLAKFSKQDIIDAIGRLYQADYIASQIVDDLEEREREKLFSEHDAALKKVTDARMAFLLWKKEVAETYGDGKNAKLIDVPPAEIMRGAALEKELNEAVKKEQRLDKKIHILLQYE